MKIVQNYIAPVLRLHEEGDKIRFDRLHGTAFCVNSRGAFITAAHVIRDAIADVELYGGGVALSLRKPDDSRNTYVGHIRKVSFAEEPYDIAVGRVAEPTQSCFVLGEGFQGVAMGRCLHGWLRRERRVTRRRECPAGRKRSERLHGQKGSAR